MKNLKRTIAKIVNRLILERRKIGMEFKKGVGLNYMSHSNIDSFPNLDSLMNEVTFFAPLRKHLAEGKSEYLRILGENSGINAPTRFNAGENFAIFLFCFIRETKPMKIIETGVANGITTNMILAATRDSDSQLHSFDTNPQCSNVSSQDNWHFHHLRKPFKSKLRKTVMNIGQVDLWIHDSDHSKDWQTFEYQLAIKYLKPRGGTLVSDDIDSSSAFSQVCKNSKGSGFALFDRSKLFGFVRMKSNF